MSLFGFLLTFSHLVIGINGLTAEQCAASDPSSLYDQSVAVADAADAILSKSFPKIVNGFFIVIDDGDTAGGQTNNYGVYGVTVAAGKDILAEGACDLINHDGNLICDENNNTLSFMLGPADVMAFVGCTPPSMRYFSFDPFINIRTSEEYPFSPGTNFGDSVNHLNINVSGEAKDVFQQPSVVLHSADAHAAQLVASAFASTGQVSEDAISVRAVDPDIVKVWDRSGGSSLDQSRPDVLSMLARFSVVDTSSPSGKKAWESYKITKFPVRFYFAPDGEAAVTPIHPAVVSREGDESSPAVNEHESLSDLLGDLKDAVMRTLSTTGHFIGSIGVTYTGKGLYDDWEEVLADKNNETYMMPTRDALYGWPVCPHDNSACLAQAGMYGALVGVIHAHALQASYSTVGLDVLDVTSGQYLESHWFLDSELVGSARRYLDPNSSDNSDDVDLLFAIDFAPPGGCLQSPAPQWCVEFSEESMLSGEGKVRLFVMGERVYSVLSTGVGPSAGNVLDTSYLAFSAVEL